MTQPPQIADSPSVAAPKSESWQEQRFEGAGLLDSTTSAANNVINFDPTALGMDALGVGMDALGFLTDPFNALTAAGIGWIIEHIGPVKEAFDGLMGDPDRIDAAAQTWDNIDARLGETAEAYRSSLSQGRLLAGRGRRCLSGQGR